MITGHNTDVKHDGTVYHVQTEDGGKDNPVIVSLIYKGGRILASKKTSYTQIVGTEGFLQSLRQMLEDQHRAMIRAVTSGAVARILAGTAKAPGSNVPGPASAPSAKPAEVPSAKPAVAPPDKPAAPPGSKPQAQAPKTPDPLRQAASEKNLDQVILEYLASEIDKE